MSRGNRVGTLDKLTLQFIIDRTVEDENGCWIWQLGINPVGYGKTSYQMSVGLQKTTTAHRLAFYIHYGYWPEVCCHICDVRACCNPAHLFSGTHSDNMADMSAKSKSGKGIKSPEKTPFRQGRQLDPKIHAAIIKLYVEHSWYQKDIASLFDMSQTGVSNILRSNNIDTKTKHDY